MARGEFGSRSLAYKFLSTDSFTIPYKDNFNIRNLKYAHLTPVFQLHNIQLAFKHVGIWKIWVFFNTIKEYIGVIIPHI